MVVLPVAHPSLFNGYHTNPRQNRYTCPLQVFKRHSLLFRFPLSRSLNSVASALVSSIFLPSFGSVVVSCGVFDEGSKCSDCLTSEWREALVLDKD
ncbi:hypothetical protein VNO78_26394 [Psophocarpus tetragonolobus]|uniref:Uncharacterized protein n=1 Tax=Psophocarpus tetragonolobus TaxID=3891 RepID=A0AAN9S1X5_PSOTE